MITPEEELAVKLLRRIDEKVDRISADIRDLTVRMTNVASGFEVAGRRLDRVDAGLERVETRIGGVMP